MTVQAYMTAVFTADKKVGIEVVSIPRTTHPVLSTISVEDLLGMRMQRYEQLLSLPAEPGAEFWMAGLREIFGPSLDGAHLDELMNALAQRNVIPVESSDPVLTTLASVGGPVAASVALYYGVSLLGPVAILAVPAGVFLLYVAKPAGEGVGGWLKQLFESRGLRGAKAKVPADGVRSGEDREEQP